jgi:hypothetical protein
MLSPQDKELLRHLALKLLAVRHPNALSEPGLTARLRHEASIEVDPDSLRSALAILRDKGLAESAQDELGSSTWWRATAQGLLAIERGL